ITQAVQQARDADTSIRILSSQVNTLYQDEYQSTQGIAPLDQTALLSLIHENETQLGTTLNTYIQNYQLADASSMQNVRNSIVSDDPAAQAVIDEQKNALNQALTPQTGFWPQFQKSLDTTLNLMSQNAPVSQVDVSNQKATGSYISFLTSWADVISTTEDADNRAVSVGSSQITPIIITTIIAFFSTIMVVIAIGYFVNLTITRPLRQLATLTKRIAKGETSARASIIGRDEIYMVATSMNNMLDNIVRLIQETQSQRDALQGQVEKLVSEVSGVGEGDLSVQAEVTADALGVLADSFNYMVEELGSLVVRVKMVANEVESSTSTILDRMTQLVEAEEAQINQISNAGIEVEAMANSSRQVAERSQLLYEVARIARKDAQGGRESVQQAIEGMGRINSNVHATASKVQNLGERSREINEIVEAMSSIAHQTNRLALDAAIQAAMAGENGKGFGAVAADIRRLAERAKDQASSVTRIVRSIREDIGSVAVSMQDTERETAIGSQLTREAGIALESIFSAVERQGREIENINQVATQQQETSISIVQVMNTVSELTQQAGVSTRDASQNMERLARLVEQLRASVEAFKLRNTQGYFAPNQGVSIGNGINLQEDPENALTVSGVFRTVSATAQPAPIPSNAFAARQTENGYTLNRGPNDRPSANQNSNGNIWNWNSSQIPGNQSRRG
ncbi:MAG TPA: methyl-accepting chemotaxis protein, partial [Ktedonobacteraceae bacterium]